MQPTHSSSNIRVAAIQLAVTSDVSENLQTCCRLIDQAATEKPDLIILPEFCNHFAWYKDREHSYEVAVALDGPFLQAIGQKAAEHQAIIMINCTVQRPNQRVTGSNILFDKKGNQIAVSDKQVLMGNENNFLDKATENCPIVELPWGRVGMYSCMDGVIFETSRGLAVRGSDILLNSLNSFAKDEGDLHIPVRAAESKVFVVAANKTGALVPPDMLEVVADRLHIAPHQLYGAGHSQIVAPDGTVLAKASHSGEAVVVADIDLTLARNKERSDGTNVMQSRRPDLYALFRDEPLPRRKPPGAEAVQTAVFQPTHQGETAVAELIAWLPKANEEAVVLISLPELFHLRSGAVKDLDEAIDHSHKMIDKVTAALAAHPTMSVATTIVERAEDDGVCHTAVLISKAGVQLQQRQLHASGRHAWITKLGDKVETVDMPWGRVGLVAGNDAIYPETFRLLVLQDVEVVAVSTQLIEDVGGQSRDAGAFG